MQWDAIERLWSSNPLLAQAATWITATVLLLYIVRTVIVMGSDTSSVTQAWTRHLGGALGFSLGLVILLLFLLKAYDTQSIWFGFIAAVIAMMITYSIENKSNKDFTFGLVAVILALRGRGKNSATEYTADYLMVHVVAAGCGLLAGGYSFFLLRVTRILNDDFCVLIPVALIVLGAFPWLFTAIIKNQVFGRLVAAGVVLVVCGAAGFYGLNYLGRHPDLNGNVALIILLGGVTLLLMRRLFR